MPQENGQQKRTLNIDLDELIRASENTRFGEARMTRAYLDLETGKIVTVSDENCPDLDCLETVQTIEGQYGTRYVRVPGTDPHQGYNDMKDFIATVENPRLREQLDAAIRTRNITGRFKGALARYPEEQARWSAFKADRVRGRLLDWLAETGVELEKVKK